MVQRRRNPTHRKKQREQWGAHEYDFLAYAYDPDGALHSMGCSAVAYSDSTELDFNEKVGMKGVLKTVEVTVEVTGR